MEPGYDCDGACLDTDDDGVCNFDEVEGCTNAEAFNYDPLATDDDESCEAVIEGCTLQGACNFDDDANVNDGSCEFESCSGCISNSACNYNPEATEDDGSCVYPGDACQDDNEATINDAYNDDCECVGVDFLETCDYIGHPEWLNTELGVYSSEFSLIDSSVTGYNLIVGEAFGTELVLNMPLVFTDEVTGGSFQVLSWSNLVADNVPPGVDLNVPETMEGGSQACLEISGVDYPTEEGLFEVSIVGEVVMNFFGTPISIGDVSAAFFIQVSSNPNGVPGCMYETASNYMPWATFDVGICEFEGCTDPEALNFSSAHTLEDGSCLYTDPSGCNENEVDHQLCLEGTVWSEELGGCVVANVSDTDFDGCVGINDFLIHLSNFGSGCGPEPAWACGDPLEYQGYDYETVQIGEQCWFAENLSADTYLNGDSILFVSDAEDWVVESGAMTRQPDNLSTDLGALYNWLAVDDSRGLCPSGWHVSTDSDWQLLNLQAGLPMDELDSIGWLGGAQDIGNKLKDPNYWNGGQGYDLFGFGARAGGYMNSGGTGAVGANGDWWTRDVPPPNMHPIRRGLHANEEGNMRCRCSGWNDGFSIRCVKDTE